MPGIRIKKAEAGLISFWDIIGMANDEVTYIKETIGAHRGIIDNTAFEGMFEEASENSEKFTRIIADRNLDKELTLLVEDWLFANEDFWLFAYDRFIEDVGEALTTKSPGGYWILDDTNYISLEAGSDDAVEFLSTITPGFMDHALYVYDNGEGLNIEFWDHEGNLSRIVSAMPSTDIIEMELEEMEEVI